MLMATKTLTVSENVSYICFPPLNAKTVKGKLAFDCPVVYLYFVFTPTFDIEPSILQLYNQLSATDACEVLGSAVAWAGAVSCFASAACCVSATVVLS